MTNTAFGVGGVQTGITDVTTQNIINANGYRLSLTTGIPVTTTDVAAAGTIYCVPFTGNDISLYSGAGSVWNLSAPGELSVAVPATTSTMYDVFMYYNGGAPALHLVAWASQTARATALGYQDGVLVLNGSSQYRYLGSFQTTTVSGETEDSYTKRFVWNYYNRQERALKRIETTATWTYSSATFRQANGSTANQVEAIVGVVEEPLLVRLYGNVQPSVTNLNSVMTGIGVNSTTLDSSTSSTIPSTGIVIGTVFTTANVFDDYPTLGYSYYAWLEAGTTNGAVVHTWWGANAPVATMTNHSGLTGYIRG